jgi:hypothetical protein
MLIWFGGLWSFGGGGGGRRHRGAFRMCVLHFYLAEGSQDRMSTPFDYVCVIGKS